MFDRDRLTAAIRGVLPPGASFCGGAIAGAAGDLHDDEVAALGAVVPKRAAEFRAGRIFARQALGALGVAAGPLLIREDRSPAWPAGAVGSISHTDAYCGVLVARSAAYAALGLDIEDVRRVDDEIAKRIVSPREARDGLRIAPRLAGPYAALVFSAKESVYKAFAPLARRFLEFADVEIDVDAAHGTFVGRVTGGAEGAHAAARSVEPRAFSGRFVFAGGAVATWATVRSDRNPAVCAG